MTDRQPQEPPDLPGYLFRSRLGSGGYADVYLYEQARARRNVAIKVLRERVSTPQTRERIAAEAELMAALSTHPNIVTIYDANVSPDGRPYLVMEYYSRPNLAQRTSEGALPVTDVLKIGIQIASAVETAHRIDIVHRDIKPANILTSDYGQPGLTDFGIATRRGGAGQDDGALSVPWAAPEMFRDGETPDRRADIYSLGATLWTLLVGRPPFHLPDGDNSPLAIWSRIERMPVPATGRRDVPESLERALQQSMAKRPDHRFATCMDLARTLQTVQHELQIPVTAIAVPDLGLTASGLSVPRHPAVATPDDDETAWRRPTTVHAQRVLVDPDVTGARPDGRDVIRGLPAPGLAGGFSPPGPPRARQGLPEAPAAETTMQRPVSPVHDQPPEPVRGPSRRNRMMILGVVVVLVVIGSAAVALLGRGTDGSGSPSSASVTPTAQDVLPQSLPEPDGTATRLSPAVVQFTWNVSDPTLVSGYLVSRTDAGTGPRPANEPVQTTTYQLIGIGPTDHPCLDVRAADTSGATSPPRRICL